MDKAVILREIGSWSIEDRIQLVQEVWDQIADAGAEAPLTAAQEAELDRRLAALEANPEDVVTWETVRDQVKRPR